MTMAVSGAHDVDNLYMHNSEKDPAMLCLEEWLEIFYECPLTSSNNTGGDASLNFNC